MKKKSYIHSVLDDEVTIDIFKAKRIKRSRISRHEGFGKDLDFFERIYGDVFFKLKIDHHFLEMVKDDAAASGITASQLICELILRFYTKRSKRLKLFD